MKRYIYNIIFLLGIHFTYSQTTEVLLKESHPVNENTILNLDLDNVSILLEESKDDNIYFDYSITFGKYSKRKRDIIVKQVKTNVTNKNDLLNLKVRNSQFIGASNYYYIQFMPKKKNDATLLTIKDLITNNFKKGYPFKSKDSLLKEIKYSEGSDITDLLKKNQHKFTSGIKNKKIIRSKFIIKLPKYVTVRVKSINSNLTFNYNILHPITISSFKGRMKFKEILSKNNKITLSNGIFQAYSIQNTSLELRDMYKVVFSEIKNCKMNTETSRIQVGEMGENVSISDFDGKYYIYNFSKNFSKFNLTGDYTKLNLYKVKESNFSMDIFGKNTTLNMNDSKTSFGISDKKEMIKILQKKSKANSPFQGNIEVELKNGILNIK